MLHRRRRRAGHYQKRIGASRKLEKQDFFHKILKYRDVPDFVEQRKIARLTPKAVTLLVINSNYLDARLKKLWPLVMPDKDVVL